MLGSYDNVFHPSVFCDSDPLSRVKIDRVECERALLLFGSRDIGPIHDPLTDSLGSLTFVLSGGNGVESPVYEHSEPGIAPPLHSLVSLGLSLIVAGS